MPAIIIPGRVIGSRPPRFMGINAASPQAQNLRVWAPLVDHVANHRGVFGTPGSTWTRSHRAIPGVDWGYDFDGTDDYVAWPNVLGSALGIPITCSAWVVPDTTNTTGYIVANASATQVYGATLFTRGATLDGTFAAIRHYSTQSTRRSSAGSVLTAGVPVLLTATIPASTTYTDFKLYLNGLEVTYSAAQSINGSGTEQALTGNHSLAGSGANFDGAITDARVYSRILTPQEVYALYHPESRWELYWVPSRRVMVDLGAAAMVRPRPQRVFGGASHGPLVGPF